jgi:C4-dicarboxylate transporter, DctQ subunit
MTPGEESKAAIDLAATSEGIGEVLPEAGRLGRLVDRFGYAFAVSIVAAGAILLMEVFLRYVFNRPTIWAHETTTFLCGIAFIYGGLYCAARNSHIRVVLIYDHVSPFWRRVLDVTISAASCIATLFFVYAGWIMVTRTTFTPGGEFRLERSGSAWNPPIPALLKIFLLVILGLLALQYLILAVNHLKRLRQPAAPTETR